MPNLTVRHCRRTESPTGAARQWLGVWYEPNVLGVNDPDTGWQDGSYETRVYEEGAFTLVFPNKVASDGVAHQARFLISEQGELYKTADEWVEIYDNNGADLLYVGTPVQVPTLDRAKLQLRGSDAYYTLKKVREYYAGYWNHAPRDVWEHYTGVWAADAASDFAGGAVPAGWAHSHTAASPVPSNVRIAPGAPATEGVIEATPAQWEIGLNGSAPYEYWQIKVQFTRNRFGSETTPPYGDNASVRVGVRDMAGPTDLLWLGLQERASYIKGPDDTPGAPGPAVLNVHFQTDPPGPYEVIVEGRERWVYFFVNQALVGVFPMPEGPYTVAPFVSVVTGDSTSTQYVDVANLLLRRCKPALMADPAAKGDYRLPGAPPPGGLHGRYYNDDDIHQAQNYAQQVFSPEREEHGLYSERLDKVLDFTAAAGYTTSPRAKWQPPGTPSDKWWSVRWVGSIYLELGQADYVLQYDTLQEGARLWVGKTRRGEEYLDNWLFNLGTTQTGGGIRAHLGHESDGAYHDGWYPILIEYGQRGTPGAEFVLRYSRGGGGFTTVPASMLSPWGIYHDQIRGDSHYEVLRTLAQAYGYQMATEPRKLEDVGFPGVLAPKVRVGRDTDKVLHASDFNIEEYSTAIDADGVADAVLGDGTGLADDSQGGQLTAEMIDYATATRGPFLRTEYESLGDIGFAPLLQQRLASILALRSSPWEEVAAKPTGERELRDTFPLTGNLAMLNWQAGDGVRLDLPAIGVEDTTPRQLLGVTRPIRPIALGAPALSFRQRPRSLREFYRVIQRRTLTKQRRYQGQYVHHSGSLAKQGTLAGIDEVTRATLPRNLAKVVDGTLVVMAKPDETPYYIWINGQPTTLPPVLAPGRYDVSSYIGRYYDADLDSEAPYMAVELRTTPS